MAVSDAGRPAVGGVILDSSVHEPSPARDPAGARRSRWADVPYRTILASIGLTLATLLTAYIVYITSRVVVWTVIAGFFAVVLARPVGWLRSKYHVRRGVAVGLVVGSSFTVVAGLIALFVIPVRAQLVAALTDLPGTVDQAAEGRGPFGRLVTQLDLQSLVREHQDRLVDAARSVQNSYPSFAGSVLQGALAAVTIAVLTCLMLSQSTVLAQAATRVVPVRHRDSIVTAARSAALAISGYMIGNLIISLCAGTAAFLVLVVLGVPNAALLALWVAFADLIPLVGATVGAAVAVLAAFFVSPTTGIVALVFFVVYQQFENSVLQVVVMARTVRVNPLGVLVSVLVGVELFGLVGALLALPIAGAASVVIKELWQHRPADPDALIVVSSATSDAADPPKNRRRRLFRRGRQRSSEQLLPER